MTSGGGPPGPPPDRRAEGRQGADAGLAIAVADKGGAGTRAEADIVLQDSGGRLSRKHARISLDNRVVVVEDLVQRTGRSSTRSGSIAPARSGRATRSRSATPRFSSRRPPPPRRARSSAH